MSVISTYSNGNSEAQVVKTVDGNYQVNYMINNKTIRKSIHLKLEQAENLAEDFVLEHSEDSGQQFLSE
jgi:hypothetical protein